MTDGTVDWFWPAAERLGIPVMLNAPTLQPEISAIASRHPGLRIILDHMGRVRGMRDETLAPAIEATITLAKHPNVFVKLTQIPECSSPPYPYKTTQPYVRRVIEAFGPRRSFWGTDLSAMLSRTDPVYRGNEIPVGRRYRMDHGTRHRRMPAVAGTIGVCDNGNGEPTRGRREGILAN